MSGTGLVLSQKGLSDWPCILLQPLQGYAAQPWSCCRCGAILHSLEGRADKGLFCMTQELELLLPLGRTAQPQNCHHHAAVQHSPRAVLPQDCAACPRSPRPAAICSTVPERKASALRLSCSWWLLCCCHVSWMGIPCSSWGHLACSACCLWVSLKSTGNTGGQMVWLHVPDLARRLHV